MSYIKEVRVQGWNGTDWVDLTADPVSASLVVVEMDHHEIHEGDFYRAVDSVALGIGDVATFIVVTPNTTKWLHMRPSVNVTAESTVVLYENVTYTGGTSVPALNANRNSGNTSGATLVKQVTTLTTGSAVALSNHLLGSNRTDGGKTDPDEWILKQNTTYCLEVTNEAAGTNNCVVELVWYEHTSAA